MRTGSTQPRFFALGNKYLTELKRGRGMKVPFKEKGRCQTAPKNKLVGYIPSKL